MTSENLGSKFTALTGLSHFGTLFAGLVAAATTVGGIAIWGADQARKIDISDKKDS